MYIARTYRTKMLLLAGGAFVAATLAGFIGSRLVNHGRPGENFWLVFPALLVVFALAAAAMRPWWRRLDDVQKAGQLVSWYWGGQIGAVVVLMALVAGTGTRSEYSRGGLAVFLGEAIFFVIAWLIWRFRLRAPAE
jgi:hypothetical protein